MMRLILAALAMSLVACAKPSSTDSTRAEAVPMPSVTTASCVYYATGHHVFCNGLAPGQADAYDCGTTNLGLRCWHYVGATNSEYSCVPDGQSASCQ